MIFVLLASIFVFVNKLSGPSISEWVIFGLLIASLFWIFNLYRVLYRQTKGINEAHEKMTEAAKMLDEVVTEMKEKIKKNEEETDDRR